MGTFTPVMKVVRVTMEEGLLRRLDSYPEVRTRGRSAVLRKAVADYLARKEAEEIDRVYAAAFGPVMPPDELEDWASEIDRAYEAAYGSAPPDDFDDWAGEAAWPE